MSETLPPVEHQPEQQLDDPNQAAFFNIDPVTQQVEVNPELPVGLEDLDKSMLDQIAAAKTPDELPKDLPQSLREQVAHKFGDSPLDTKLKFEGLVGRAAAQSRVNEGNERLNALRAGAAERRKARNEAKRQAHYISEREHTIKDLQAVNNKLVAQRNNTRNAEHARVYDAAHQSAMQKGREHIESVMAKETGDALNKHYRRQELEAQLRRDAQNAANKAANEYMARIDKEGGVDKLDEIRAKIAKEHDEAEKAAAHKAYREQLEGFGAIGDARSKGETLGVEKQRELPKAPESQDDFVRRLRERGIISRDSLPEAPKATSKKGKKHGKKNAGKAALPSATAASQEAPTPLTDEELEDRFAAVKHIRDQLHGTPVSDSEAIQALVDQENALIADLTPGQLTQMGKYLSQQINREPVRQGASSWVTRPNSHNSGAVQAEPENASEVTRPDIPIITFETPDPRTAETEETLDPLAAIKAKYENEGLSADELADLVDRENELTAKYDKQGALTLAESNELFALIDFLNDVKAKNEAHQALPASHPQPIEASPEAPEMSDELRRIKELDAKQVTGLLTPDEERERADLVHDLSDDEYYPYVEEKRRYRQAAVNGTDESAPGAHPAPQPSQPTFNQQPTPQPSQSTHNQPSVQPQPAQPNQQPSAPIAPENSGQPVIPPETANEVTTPIISEDERLRYDFLNQLADEAHRTGNWDEFDHDFALLSPEDQETYKQIFSNYEWEAVNEDENPPLPPVANGPALDVLSSDAYSYVDSNGESQVAHAYRPAGSGVIEHNLKKVAQLGRHIKSKVTGAPAPLPLGPRPSKQSFRRARIRNDLKRMRRDARRAYKNNQLDTFSAYAPHSRTVVYDANGNVMNNGQMARWERETEYQNDLNYYNQRWGNPSNAFLPRLGRGVVSAVTGSVDPNQELKRKPRIDSVAEAEANDKQRLESSKRSWQITTEELRERAARELEKIDAADNISDEVKQRRRNAINARLAAMNSQPRIRNLFLRPARRAALRRAMDREEQQASPSEGL